MATRCMATRQVLHIAHSIIQSRNKGKTPLRRRLSRLFIQLIQQTRRLTSMWLPHSTARSVHVTHSRPPSRTHCTAASRNGAAVPCQAHRTQPRSQIRRAYHCTPSGRNTSCTIDNTHERWNVRSSQRLPTARELRPSSAAARPPAPTHPSTADVYAHKGRDRRRRTACHGFGT